MAELIDSGKKRDFGTGAHRDAAEGKGRCDLLPLYEAALVLDNDPVLLAMEEFYQKWEISRLLDVISVAVKNMPQFGGSGATFLLEASHQYEDGAKKYGENNWKNGIPLDVYIDSGVRHYLKAMRGDTDEPHHRAFAWNMLGALWTLRHSGAGERKA